MLQTIPISHIKEIKNYRDTEPVTLVDPEIQELANSIKKDGVLQPVLLRPDKSKAGSYQLIFGHRRLVASKMAGLTDIPANIREVADADILEIQITENLQRKDVHPMDEAKAFLAFQTKSGCDVAELAAKFAKSERYIAHRLGLNNLIQQVPVG